ncbi:MAG: hypothetical protein KDA96_05690 [Planctomycetaceae bacterium]|nr:hypothetical protein [Planctomycetaceae bacterium]
MRTQLAPRSVRRLLSADGYLDIGMPEKAIAELEQMGEAGPLEGPRRLMMGIALKHAGRTTDAVTHLEHAARIMPAPIRQFAWRELVPCYREAGSEELARLAEKLSDRCDYQLRIALPFSQLTLNLTPQATN